MRTFCAIILLCICALCHVPGAEAQKRTSQSVKKERQDAKRDIKRTQEKLAENKRRISNQLNDLNAIEAEITQNGRSISKERDELARCDKQIARLRDTIRCVQGDIDRIKHSAVSSLREARTRRQSLSSLSMIFSSGSFKEAVKRAGYLQQLDRSRARKAVSLQGKLDELARQQARLDTLRQERAGTLSRLEALNDTLVQNQQQSQQLVDQLQRDRKSLEAELAERKKRAAALDRELDNIIAEEQRIAAEQERKRQEAAEKKKREEEAARKREEEARAKAEAQKKEQETAQPRQETPKENKVETPKTPEKKTEKKAETPKAPKVQPGDFAQQKGKLPYPVNEQHKVVSQFGRSKHADLSKVEVENSGIDIQTVKGANARAVFPGVVSSIFQLDGYCNIVMVRHGEYITIYANIDKLNVKKGDEVEAGQVLGRIYSDSKDGDRTILHFEVRHEREKLNPSLWLKP